MLYDELKLIPPEGRGVVSAITSLMFCFVTVCSVVNPTSFVYGNSIDASRFVQLEDMECNFQPLNFTFQVLVF